MICPKCHFEQPDDIFCASCGVNIEKYNTGGATAPKVSKNPTKSSGSGAVSSSGPIRSPKKVAPSSSTSLSAIGSRWRMILLIGLPIVALSIFFLIRQANDPKKTLLRMSESQSGLEKSSQNRENPTEAGNDAVEPGSEKNVRSAPIRAMPSNAARDRFKQNRERPMPGQPPAARNPAVNNPSDLPMTPALRRSMKNNPERFQKFIEDREKRLNLPTPPLRHPRVRSAAQLERMRSHRKTAVVVGEDGQGNEPVDVREDPVVQPEEPAGQPEEPVQEGNPQPEQPEENPAQPEDPYPQDNNYPQNENGGGNEPDQNSHNNQPEEQGN
jgi:hypothetical protein